MPSTDLGVDVILRANYEIRQEREKAERLVGGSQAALQECSDAP